MPRNLLVPLVAIVIAIGGFANTARAQGGLIYGGFLGGIETNNGNTIDEQWMFSINLGMGGEFSGFNPMVEFEFGTYESSSFADAFLFTWRVAGQGEVFLADPAGSPAVSFVFGAGIGLRYLFTHVLSIEFAPTWLSLDLDTGLRVYFGGVFVFLTANPSLCFGIGQWQDGEFSDTFKPSDRLNIAAQIGIGARF